MIKYYYRKYLYRLQEKKLSKNKDNIPIEEYDTFANNPLTEANPSGQLEEKEKAEILQNAIASLSPKYRSIIILYYYEELSRKEIAEALNTTVHSVDHILRRARIKIKEKLEGKLKKKIVINILSGAGYSSFIAICLNKESNRIANKNITDSLYENIVMKLPNTQIKNNSLESVINKSSLKINVKAAM